MDKEKFKHDRDAAFEKLVKAAETGDVNAQRTLALLYINGSLFMEPDHEKALYWSRKAAAAGDTVCQGYLARMQMFDNTGKF